MKNSLNGHPASTAGLSTKLMQASLSFFRHFSCKSLLLTKSKLMQASLSLQALQLQYTPADDSLCHLVFPLFCCRTVLVTEGMPPLPAMFWLHAMPGLVPGI
jgi:hypothetical protein